MQYLTDLYLFLFAALKAFHRARAGHGLAYAGVSRAGVMGVAVFVGLGREAWRVSQRAVEEFRNMETNIL